MPQTAIRERRSAAVATSQEDLLLKTHFLAAGRRRSTRSRAKRGHRRPGRLRRARRGRLQRARGARRRRASQARLPQDATCPTTASSTSSATSRSATSPALDRASNGATHRPHDLRGHLGAGAAGQRGGARGRRGDRQHLRLAVPRGQGRRARADARSSARATTSPTSSSATSSAARTSSSSTATASSIDQDGELIARGAAVRGGADRLRHRPRRRRSAARLRDARHRAAPPRPRGPTVRRCSATARGAGAPRRRPRSAARARSRSSPEAEVYAALCARPARLRRQERLRARRARPLRRDRLGAGRAASRSTRSGAERVACAVMPSPYSSEGTQRDARTLAEQPRRRALRARRSSRRCAAYDEVLAERVRRAPSPASPRRTSRRASAATC